MIIEWSYFKNQIEEFDQGDIYAVLLLVFRRGYEESQEQLLSWRTWVDVLFLPKNEKD